MPFASTSATAIPNTTRRSPTARGVHIAYFERMARSTSKRVTFKRVLATAALWSCTPQQADRRQQDGPIDIFRLTDDGRIVEHWDVLQVVPPTSANANTMF